MITGKAKTDYQREYMRRRRANAGSNASVRPKPVRPSDSVRPIVRPTVRPKAQHAQPETQSFNPMMIGYVPD